MEGDLKDYFAYRLSRASGILNDAKILAKNKSWNSCVNRLYYSSFYTVTALLISKGFQAKIHNGVKTILFNNVHATSIDSVILEGAYSRIALSIDSVIIGGFEQWYHLSGNRIRQTFRYGCQS